MAVILGVTLALWLLFLAMFEIGQVPAYVMAIPLYGLLLCSVYHSFMIRCPCCRKRLGHVTRSLLNFSLLRFPKRVRFCPYCTVDFQDDVHTRR